MRIVDHVGFLRHIAPVLGRRLAHSLLASFSGNLDINTMTRVLRLQFQEGRLLSVGDADDAPVQATLRMPPLLLIQLVLGYRSCQEIMDCYLDAYVRPGMRQLVDILFPKVESFIYPAV